MQGVHLQVQITGATESSLTRRPLSLATVFFLLGTLDARYLIVILTRILQACYRPLLLDEETRPAR